MRWGASGIMVCATCVVSGRISASTPTTVREPAVLVAPRFAAATSLRVDRETLKLDCHELAATLVCAFEATYRTTNPDAEAAQVLGAFYGIGATEVVITIDGNVVSQTPSPTQRKSLDDAVFGRPHRPGVPAEDAAHDDDEAMNGPFVENRGTVPNASWAFTIATPPKSAHELVVRGNVAAARRVMHSGDGSEDSPRHPVLSTIDTDAFWDLEYFVSPLRTWDADPTVIGHALALAPPRGRRRVGRRGAGAVDRDAAPGGARVVSSRGQRRKQV